MARLHRFLDEPERILLWTPDEFIALILPLAIGTVVVNGLVGVIAGVVCWQLLAKVKRGDALVSFLRWLYWSMPPGLLKTGRFPPAHWRELAG
jgi:conjugal transfer pilus assembly protein TraL